MKNKKFSAGEWAIMGIVGFLVFAACFGIAGCIFTFAVYLVCNFLLPIFGVQPELATYQYWQTGFILCFIVMLFNANRLHRTVK